MTNARNPRLQSRDDDTAARIVDDSNAFVVDLPYTRPVIGADDPEFS